MRSQFAFSILLILLLPFCLFAKVSEIFDYQMSGFEHHDYESAVNALVKKFEETKKITPGATGLIALRIYTYSGPGLCTPHDLVLSLSRYLEKCGFQRKNILIVGDSQQSLRECGYLPRLSQQARWGLMFAGMPVFWIGDEKFHDKNWVYINTLASDNILKHAVYWSNNERWGGANNFKDSYLPTILMFGVDGWIDLPVYIGSLEHGVIGSLIQSSILNISNNKRFLANPSNCASAAAQIAAIPELKKKHIFTITSLEHFQYSNSLVYDENYACSLPHVLLSADPVALDSLCLQVMNEVKAIYNFRFLRDRPVIFRYAEELGIGRTRFNVIKIKKAADSAHCH